MEKQTGAEREAPPVLTAEGLLIDHAEGGTEQHPAGRAGPDPLGPRARPRACVFQAVHDGDADRKVLAYQYLQTLPQLWLREHLLGHPERGDHRAQDAQYGFGGFGV